MATNLKNDLAKKKEVESIMLEVDRKIYFAMLRHFKPLESKINVLISEMEQLKIATDLITKRVEDGKTNLSLPAAKLRKIFSETFTPEPRRHMIKWNDAEQESLENSLFKYISMKSTGHDRHPSGIMYRIVRILKDAGVDLEKIK